MKNSVDIKNLIQHIVRGTVAEKLCRICLVPLDQHCENMYTKICKGDQEYCIADVLDLVFHTKISEVENSSVCSNCFISASAAFKFYLLLQSNNEILTFYIDQIQSVVEGFDLSTEFPFGEKLGISLPTFEPSTEKFDYDLEGLALQSYLDEDMTSDNESYDSDLDVNSSHIQSETVETGKVRNGSEIKKECLDHDDDDVVVVMQENSAPAYYKPLKDGTFKEVNDNEKGAYDELFKKSACNMAGSIQKPRRYRSPMIYRECSKCPTKYRFISKLKEHMKSQHNIELYVCQVCKDVTEDSEKYKEHIKQHDIHPCNLCNMAFKRRDTLVAHMKKHEQSADVNSAGAHVCEICGLILPTEEMLHDHYDKKHEKKYTCYYCGRMYKGEASFNVHIKKHELHMMMKKRDGAAKHELDESTKQKKSRSEHMCPTCGRTFVDERSLMWHQRLHSNERPYTCETCGRGFVSLNRRNQHALCAHSAPARRCPLCPALFHLRSMVNSHIKKVHLRAHKRRNRTSKYAGAFWRTETVPIQELSVAIQSDLLELQSQQDNRAA